MSIFPSISAEYIESISKILGDCGSGSEISTYFTQMNILDNSGESTKWRRLNHVFNEQQTKYQVSNKMFEFILKFMSPARYVEKIDIFNEKRQKLNIALGLIGYEYGEDGRIRRCETSKTLDEAEERVKTLRSRLKGRDIHPEIIKYCKKELMQDNYFHAVFEATKGLAQYIKGKAGVDQDGVKLIDTVFSIKHPILAFNTLKTESEQSEHKGFANLLKGCFGAIRNPLAHEPKILWEGEDDALDYFTIISLLYKKVEKCVLTGLKI